MKEAKHVSKKSNSTNKSTDCQLKASQLGIQAKLQIGQPGDKYEREADAIADHVVRSSGPLASRSGGGGVRSPQIQRKCSACEQEEKLQRKPLVSEISPLQIQQQRFPVYGRYKSQKDSFPEFCTHPNYMYNEETGCESPSIRYGWKPRSSKIIIDGKCKGGLKAKITEAEDFHEIGVCPDNEQIPIQAKEDGTLQGPSASFESTLSTSKSGGSPLPESTRNEMESKIGADFSQVRVHTNSSAIQMSQDIGAQAFTHGKDVYFNTGKYSPNTTEGKHLLAHELVHTVQQISNTVRRKKADIGMHQITANKLWFNLDWPVLIKKPQKKNTKHAKNGLLLKKGVFVQVIGHKDNYWAIIDYYGAIGYIARKHLQAINKDVNDANSKRAKSSESIAVTVIDDSDFVGWISSAFRIGEVYMINVKSMVKNIIKSVSNKRISRLNIIDHGNKYGVQIGNDFISEFNIDKYIGDLKILRNHFASNGFVHIQGCQVGQNIRLIKIFSAIFGVPVYAGTGDHNPLYRFNFGEYVKCFPDGKCLVKVNRP